MNRASRVSRCLAGLVSACAVVGCASGEVVPRSERSSGSEEVARRVAPASLAGHVVAVEDLSSFDAAGWPGGAAPGLNQVLDWLEGAPVVGIGESLHGTDTFHRAAQRLFQYAAEGPSGERRFDVLALEISQVHAALLDEFVLGQRDDLEELLAQRWWVSKVFYGTALRDLLLWMRGHNLAVRGSGGVPLRIAGYDFKHPDFAMEALASWLEAEDPALAEKARIEYRSMHSLGGLGVFPNVSGLTAHAVFELPRPGEQTTFTVDFEIRALARDYGWAGAALSFPGSEGPRRPIAKWFKPDQLGEGWTKVRLSHLFTPTGDQARLTFFHRGDGTVQVRNLQVSIDGESVPAPERKAKTTDGPDDQPPSHFDRFEAQGLQMPHLQQMDYSLARLPDPRKGGREGLLELRCAARVDRARRALDWLDRLVSQASTTSAGARDSAWPSQLARLIRQSIDWRTLYEPNRDVYLAENVLWLHRTRFPGQRLLVFGHSSHTENQDQRMGKILLEELGDDYRTVTLRTLGGAFRYFGPVGEAGPDPPLEKVTLDPARSSALSRGLAELVGDGFATGGLAANLTAMASTEDGRAWLQELAPDAVRPDIQLVIPAVDPIVLAEETRPDGDEPPAYVRPPGL